MPYARKIAPASCLVARLSLHRCDKAEILPAGQMCRANEVVLKCMQFSIGATTCAPIYGGANEVGLQLSGWHTSHTSDLYCPGR